MIDLEQVFDGNSNNARLKDLSLYLSLYYMIKLKELIDLCKEDKNEVNSIFKYQK
jgi:hypothetical protein